MTDDNKRNRRKPNKYLLMLLGLFIVGASVDVFAVTSLTCLFGLLCNPNPITGVGNITLLPSNDSVLGGVYAFNCTGTDKISQILTNGSSICSADISGSGSAVKTITLVNGLGSNESPIVNNASLYLLNATNLQLGGVFVANCTAGTVITGWNGSNYPTCSTVNNGSGTVTSITEGTGIKFSTSPITTTGVIHLQNATTSTIGGVKTINCTSTDKISGYDISNTPVCTADVGGTPNPFILADRIEFVKTFVNVGTTFVDVYSTAFQPQDTLINTTGKTQFRIQITVDYIGAGTQSTSFNQTTTNANALWMFNYTADCDPCDSGWRTLPAWASSVETNVEEQAKSTTAGDDPSYKGYQMWLG